MGRLLVVACSQRKSPAEGKIPAIERYDGPVFRVLRKFLVDSPEDPPQILILSARFGLIEASKKIPDYDCRLSQEMAARLREQVLKQVREVIWAGRWERLGICVGRDYWTLLDGLEQLAGVIPEIDRLGGGLGKRLTNLHKWLRDTNEDEDAHQE